MEQSNIKSFKNRGSKRLYITLPLMLINLYLFCFAIGVRWSIPTAAILPGLVMILFFPQKYVLSNENTIEFYHLFGRKKRLSVHIENISEITVKPNKLSLDYRKEGFTYPLSLVLELSDTDMVEVQHELLKRNPAISLS